MVVTNNARGQQACCKRILIIDDDPCITLIFKKGIENRSLPARYFMRKPIDNAEIITRINQIVNDIGIRIRSE
jgi:hypothetical protein